MFTDKIDPLIYNGVTTIGGSILFSKVLEKVAGTGLMTKENSTQRN